MVLLLALASTTELATAATRTSGLFPATRQQRILRARLRACREAQRDLDRAIRRLVRRGLDPALSRTALRLRSRRDRGCRGLVVQTTIVPQVSDPQFGILSGTAMNLDPSGSRSFSIAVGIPNLFFPRLVVFPSPASFAAQGSPGVAGSPGAPASTDAPVDLPETSKVWLLPVSGLVVGLGALLLRRRRHHH